MKRNKRSLVVGLGLSLSTVGMGLTTASYASKIDNNSLDLNMGEISLHQIGSNPLQSSGSELDRLYQEVISAIRFQKPQEALLSCKKLIDKSLKDKNFPYYIESLLTQYNIEEALDYESDIATLISKLNEISSYKWLTTADKTILDLVMCQVYQHNSGRLVSGREFAAEIAIGTYVPTWSYRQFLSVEAQLLARALNHISSLQSSTAKEYYPLLRIQESDKVVIRAMEKDQKEVDNESIQELVLQKVQDFVSYEMDSDTMVDVPEGHLNGYDYLRHAVMKASEQIDSKENKCYADYILLTIDKGINRVDVTEYLSKLKDLITRVKGCNLSATLLEDYIETYRSYEEPDTDQKKVGSTVKVPYNEENLKFALEVLHAFKTEESYGYKKSLSVVYSIIQPYFSASINVRFALNTPIIVDFSEFYPSMFESLHIKIEQLENNINQRDTKVIREVMNRNFPVSQVQKRGDKYILDLMQSLPSGVYRLTLKAEVKPQTPEAGHFTCQAVSSKFVVSNLLPIILPYGNGAEDIRVVDLTTGHPIPKVTATLSKQIWDRQNERYIVEPVQEEVSDKEGLISLNDKTFNDNASYYVSCRTKNDQPMDFVPLFNYGRFNSYDNNLERTQDLLYIYTDRSSYRPGQKVKFSGFAYRIGYLQKDGQILPDKTVTIRLKDVNNDEVEKIEVTTDQRGNFEGEFTLPQKTLTGEFTIVSDRSECSFYVEEYKRPTFDIKLSKPEGIFRFGDKIQINGSAQQYSGVPLMGAKVSWITEVTSINPYWWQMDYRHPTVIDQGFAICGNDGKFDLPIKLTLPDNLNRLHENNPQTAFVFTTQVTVTSSNGETHTDESIIVVGTPKCRITPLFGTTNVEALNQDNNENDVSYLNKSDLTIEQGLNQIFKFKVDSPFGNLPQIKHLTFELLTADGSLIDSYQIDQSKKAVGGEKFSIKKLKDGTYKYHVEVETTEGMKADSDGEVVIYSDKTQTLSTSNVLTIFKLDDTYGNGHHPSFLVGTKLENADLFYDVIGNNNLLLRKHIVLKKGKLSRIDISDKLLTLPKYGLRIYMVRDGRLYSSWNDLCLREEIKELQIKQKSFRTLLETGKEETWSFVVTDKNGNPIKDASVAAFMFDASLLALHPYSLPNMTWKIPYRLPVMSALVSNNEIYNWISPYFRAPQINIPRRVGYNISSGQILIHPKFNNRTMLTSNILTDEMNAVPTEQGKGFDDLSASKGISNKSKPQIRSNFAETAFFYPTLTTDAEGICTWSFKLPDAMTSWKLYMIGHNDALDFTEKSYDVKTVKQFMVMSNMPRFVRMGDDGMVSASIYNMSDNSVSPIVSLELFDPETGQVLHKENREIRVEAKASASVTFPLKAQSDLKMIGVRIVADSKLFSDGEEKILPQLSNIEPAHTSIPVMLLPNESKEIDLYDYLPKNLPNDTRITIHKDGSILWPILRTLPSITSPHNDAISISSAIYASRIANFITQNPKFGAIKDKILQSNPDVKSTLRTQPEVYDMIDSEMPWIKQAELEEANAKEVLNMLKGVGATLQMEDMMAQLKQLQNEDGGYSWMPAMKSNYYASEYVALLFTRLNNMLHDTYQIDDVLAYLKRENTNMLDDIMKLPEAKRYLPQNFVRYAYILALQSESPKKDGNPVLDYTLKYLFSKMNKHQLTLDQLPEAAVIANRFGKFDLAQDAVESLRQHLTYKDGQGAFFAMKMVNPYWCDTRYPLHIASMEAFSEILKDGDKKTELINRMKQWLISQKRVQTWPSTPATSDIVYGLFMNTNKGHHLSDIIDSMLANMIPSTQETNLPQNGKIKIQNNSEGILWGAVYVDYKRVMGQEKKAKIASDQPMVLSEQAYRVVIENGQEKLKPIKEGEALKIGDEIRTIYQVKIDRAMDFIVLNSGRSAATEPMGELTGYRYGGGTWYYFEAKDVQTNFFFDALQRGRYQVEFSQRIVREGIYHSGKSILRSAYSRDFSTELPGQDVIVK